MIDLSSIICTIKKILISSDQSISLLSDLIALSGIFAGLVSAFISSQIFKLKSDREQILEEIIELSKKLTNYKRIIYDIKSSSYYWKTFDDINELYKKYNGITFDKIHNSIKNDSEGISRKFWLEEDKIDIHKADLYLSMSALLDDDQSIPRWLSDKYVVLKFSEETLEKYIQPSNQIWYYLDYKFHKYMEGSINPEGITGYWLHQILETLSLIDPKLKTRQFDRKLLADISSEFSEYYIPRLLNLTKRIKSKLPQTIRSLLINLIYLLIVGVLFPIIIKLFTYNDLTTSILTTIAGFGVISGFIWFLISFIGTIKKEVTIF